MAKTPGDYGRPKDADPTDRMLMVPGINEPLAIPEPGFEGARAVCEYRTFVEGRIIPGHDYDADNMVRGHKFRTDYNDDYMINDSKQEGAWHEEDGEGGLPTPKGTEQRDRSSVKRLGKYGMRRSGESAGDGGAY